MKTNKPILTKIDDFQENVSINTQNVILIINYGIFSHNDDTIND